MYIIIIKTRQKRQEKYRKLTSLFSFLTANRSAVRPSASMTSTFNVGFSAISLLVVVMSLNSTACKKANSSGVRAKLEASDCSMENNMMVVELCVFSLRVERLMLFSCHTEKLRFSFSFEFMWFCNCKKNIVM